MRLHTFGPLRAFDILYDPRTKMFGDPYFTASYRRCSRGHRSRSVAAPGFLSWED